MRSSNLKFVAAAALAAIALAACSSSSKTAGTDTTPATNAPTTVAAEPATTPTAATPTTAAPAGGAAAVVKIADSKFGKILVDSKGMTLYVDENDKPGAPACTGACLQAWPPVVAPATASFGTGLSGKMFGDATLSNGTKQLTVNGFPLYTWTADQKPGDVTGQGVNHFYAVMANGVKYDPS
jgi:predicted lipoprotein with Yx(FWY)xxD motif